MFGRKKVKKEDYDREHLIPVLHCSICTGETAAGFKDIRTGRFTEVMLIRNDKDLREFKERYDLDEVKKEY